MKLKNIYRLGMTIVALIAVTLSPQAQAQNLVPNSGFEDTNIKKLRSYGQMEEVSNDWFSATEVPADIYGDGAKGDKIAIPKNVISLDFGPDSMVGLIRPSPGELLAILVPKLALY